MKKKVIIAYASKHGATEEIAFKIGDIISNFGNHTDILNVENVGNLSSYDAILIGSAVYMGQWRKSAVKFVKVNAEVLAGKNVWIFSTGPTGEGDPNDLLKGWKIPESLQPMVDKIKPVDIKIFHGVLDEAKLNTLEKMTVKMVKAQFGDFRNWNDIEEWAKSVAKQLVG